MSKFWKTSELNNISTLRNKNQQRKLLNISEDYNNYREDNPLPVIYQRERTQTTEQTQDVGVDPRHLSKNDLNSDASLFLHKNEKSVKKKFAFHYYGNINNKFGVLKTFIQTEDNCNLEDYINDERLKENEGKTEAEDSNLYASNVVIPRKVIQARKRDKADKDLYSKLWYLPQPNTRKGIKGYMLKRYATEVKENITGQFNPDIYDKGFLIRKVNNKTEVQEELKVEHNPIDMTESRGNLSKNSNQNTKVNINLTTDKQDKRRQVNSLPNKTHLSDLASTKIVNLTKTTLEADDNTFMVSPKFLSTQPPKKEEKRPKQHDIIKSSNQINFSFNADYTYNNPIRMMTEGNDNSGIKSKRNNGYQRNNFIDKLNDAVQLVSHGQTKNIRKKQIGNYIMIDDTFKHDNKLTLNGKQVPNE